MTSVAPSASRRLAAGACSVQSVWSLPVTNSVGQRMWASREVRSGRRREMEMKALTRAARVHATQAVQDQRAGLLCPGCG
jgi:hypothetical protein